MTKYNFETHKREDGEELDLILRAIFEYKGQELEAVTSIILDKPRLKEQQKELLEITLRKIHQYKLEN